MTNEGTDESETVNSLFLKGLELHDKIVDGGGEISDEVTAVRKVRTRSFPVKGQQIFDTSAVSYFFLNLD